VTIGKLEKVPLRDLWKHEEYDFSAWLNDNLDRLSDALGVQLLEPEKEVGAGTFEVDLVAEDADSNRVVIENQLEPTDHDHLGKLITYLTNLDAKTAIWIAHQPRPEHIKAVGWLNEITPDDISFYLVQLDAYRIGESPPAPLFTVIVGPSRESKGFGQQKKDLAERHILRLRFWEGLLAKAKAQGVLTHAGRSPGKDSWLAASAGKAGLSLTYSIWKKDDSAVELYIDTGDQTENKQIFDTLLSQKAAIEATFGAPLDWERLDQKRAARIRSIIHKGGLADGEANWPNVQEAMIGAMARLLKALKPHLGKL
jgi:hypothetical protein